MLENVRLAFQGIWSHKMRSFLTMLGIIIGIAAIITIVSTIQGTNDQLAEAMIGSRNNTVKVTLSQGDFEFNPTDAGDGTTLPPVVSAEAREKILRLKEVEDMTCYLSSQYYDSIYYQNSGLTNFYLYGVEDNYFDLNALAVRSGRGFLPDDGKNFRKVLVLDVDAAEGLFGNEDPIGKTVEIKNEPFTVIGVVTDTLAVTTKITDVEDFYTNYTNSNGSVYMPIASWPIVYDFDQPQNVIVKATSTDNMTRAGQRSAKILNEAITKQMGDNSSTDITYTSENLAEQVKQQQEVENQTRRQLIPVACIALLVGGIGVMNIMLVSVTERTAEIGLKKAIGARKSAILGQFLTEAVVLTSLGGVLGVAAGVAASQIYQNISGTRVGFNVPWALISVGFSMAIGIIFGILPSMQAANLDPIEALRRE